MNKKIVIRQRWPNFVCDGRPLGPDPETYMIRFDTVEEFYELDWVKDRIDCVGWFLSQDETWDIRAIMAVYRNEDGTGTVAWHAVLEEGTLDIDVHDKWYEDEESFFALYGLTVKEK